MERAPVVKPAGSEELSANLVHVPVSGVPQNDVASRWSWVTPTAGSGRRSTGSKIVPKPHSKYPGQG